MDKKREMLFIDELETQIKFALLSIENINDFLENMDIWENSEVDKFWYYAQNLIVYSGNISKILWGVWNKKNKTLSQKREAERSEFRLKLNVSESSLLKRRYLRNALEHIDEKLEEFTNHPQNLILNKNMGPIKGLIQIEEKEYDISKEKNLRHYDLDAKIYYFYGENINLEELFKAIKELEKNIKEYKIGAANR